MKTDVYFVTKTPPASDLLKKALKLDKASGKPGHTVAGTLSPEKLRELASLIQRSQR
jgi:large subunit ribosomal protein L11